MSSLSEARGAAAICREVARATWAKAHDGAECPENRIPTPEVLADWLPQCAAEDAAVAMTDSRGRNLRGSWVLGVFSTGTETSPERCLMLSLKAEFQDLLRGEAGPVRGGPRVVMLGDSWLGTIEQVHERWAQARSFAIKLRSQPSRHPLASLVDAWQRLVPVSTEWDARQHRNLPGPIATTHNLVTARELRDGQTALPFDFDTLMTTVPPPDEPRFEVGYLPTLAPEPSKLVPTALLSLWDVAGLGGASRGRHGPVPIPRRIGMEAILAVPPDARINESVYLDTILGRLAAGVWPQTVRMLPDGTVTGYRVDRHGAPLLEALRVVHGPEYGSVAWVDSSGGARRVLVMVRDWPRTLDAGAKVGLVVALPPGSNRQGPMVDALVLRLLAATSARQHRMMLTAYCLWDRYGTINGRLIASTRPVVERHHPAGYVTDTRGKVVEERGAPTRRATHHRAVQTGERERNPEADRYPWLEGPDLILVGHPVVGVTAATRRDQRRRVMETATALRDAGHLNFEVEYRSVRGGRELVALRLLPSAAHVKAHAARWAARKHGAR